MALQVSEVGKKCKKARLGLLPPNGYKLKEDSVPPVTKAKAKTLRAPGGAHFARRPKTHFEDTWG